MNLRVKPFIYTNNIMVWGDSMKAQDKISPLGKRKQEFWLQINLEKTVMLRLLRRGQNQSNENKQKQDTAGRGEKHSNENKQKQDTAC
jgi:hypothetical protein